MGQPVKGVVWYRPLFLGSRVIPHLKRCGFLITQMAKLPLLNAVEVSRILDKLGFKFKRQQGSHMFFEHPDKRTTVIPNHPGRDIGRGLLNKIIKHDLQISRDEFLKLM